MSLRKCEKLSARMIEKVVACATRGARLRSSERLVLIHLLPWPGPAPGPRARITRNARAWLYCCPRLSDGSHPTRQGNTAGEERGHAATQFRRARAGLDLDPGRRRARHGVGRYNLQGMRRDGA